MNDRIKELADQAFESAHKENGGFPIMLQKFTELIVRECANKAYHTAFDDLTHSETESQIPGHIYREVLEHFGVE